MTDILLLVSAIAILQVGGAYVRYTPFAGIMDDKTKHRLFYADCLVLLINMSWQILLFDQFGFNLFIFKCCLALDAFYLPHSQSLAALYPGHAGHLHVCPPRRVRPLPPSPIPR